MAYFMRGVLPTLTYDSIGNRLWSAENAATNTYAANCLNQYTSISNLCASMPPCEPTNPDNPVNPVQENLSSLREFSYDADGNLLSDGVLTYAYDAGNRLLSVTSATLTNGAIRVVNAYDAQGRRVRKTVQRLNSTTPLPPSPPTGTQEWQTVETRTFAWDGNNIVLESIGFADGSTRICEYFWGNDKSGTEQGAGGVGGLLAVSITDSQPTNSPTPPLTNSQYFIPCYDHNGNIVRYVSEAGATVAQYLYDPYGNVVEASGPLTDQFSFGFSTKYHDRETGLISYQQRFYHPQNGRWLNRDPIEERGGENLYAFCGNASPFRIDPLGRNLLDIHASRIRAFLEMGNEEMAAGEAFLLYHEIAMGGNIQEPLAAQLLNHWLHGSGRAFAISSSHVKSAMLYDKPEGDSPKSQLYEQLCSAKCGKSGTLSGLRMGLTAREGTYYHAFGSFFIVFSGSYKCRKGGFKFTGNWDFEDTYDWHNGLSANVLGTEIEDSWANLVKEYKGANDFDEKGSWNGTINVDCSSSGVEGGGR